MIYIVTIYYSIYLRLLAITDNIIYEAGSLEHLLFPVSISFRASFGDWEPCLFLAD